ncbi:glutathione s-transferase, n-terminal domain containing protein [Toxoplasma gondii TgCatPRC2]|uniref:Glutathione s-transferase, n-terminal domain containing protein n=15 Tax=Toxoplasma gondii TaxID=5811 RepID=B9PZA9_TOXGV|nr:glutathione s-transferase, n-terminal domain containing protein [Toxoplasma gondii ME49]EPR57496.1 glutathione s-transferase, n-terminal domain containing protein [Toxoplasma gondii GT1]ESS28991.1 glutathione s-transferase, n-terminal domain containing protein [Toxoplasma gondii VEG]KAF4644762.1 glutathione s-transferase, n-terminal domain containing protein [Toxoplasma gondii]KFG30323.1 glutathione s-transferase, n-terminal domain containing protein [Toxoplasma gondii p89]KFG33488.1 glutat|eukprot:XP_002370375.1 glutathione s-transferase, n-terminal domain containing protein [Toxoplasma gondii ME49]
MKLAHHIYRDIRSRGALAVLGTASLLAPRFLRHLIASFFQFLQTRIPFVWPFVNWISLWLVDVLRLFSGYFAASGLERCKRPQIPLRLYEFEGCPFCRKVRETLSVLALECDIFPCPRETLQIAGYCRNSRYRPAVKAAGGALMFPYLEDPNTDIRMYQSDEIIKYLWREYGASARAPLNYRLAKIGVIEMLSLPLTTFCRPMMTAGILRIPSELPKKPLELWGCEASAPSRRVREVLTSLELPYRLHTTAIGSGRMRPSPVGKTRSWPSAFPANCFGIACYASAVPTYLRDPNTDTEIGSSAAIVQYLLETYQRGAPPQETWMMYGKKNPSD